MKEKQKEKIVVNERVNAALEGMLSPDELTEEEQAVWIDKFMKNTAEPGPNVMEIYADLHRLAISVGLDNNGKLIRGSDE